MYKNCDFAISPNHCHPSYSFIYSLKLNGHFVLNGEKITPPKEYSNKFICAFSPNVLHQEVIEKGFSNYIAIFINKEYFEKELAFYSTQEIECKGELFPPNETLMNLLKQLMDEYSKDTRLTTRVQDTLNTLITNILIETVLNQDNCSKSTSFQTIIENSISYMHKNICQKLTVKDIASQVNTSTSHFSKIFRESMGKSPIEYLTYIRVEKSKRLLKVSDKNMTEIGFESGFSSSSYFSYCFIESEKMTPSQYRKLYSSKLD